MTRRAKIITIITAAVLLIAFLIWSPWSRNDYSDYYFPEFARLANGSFYCTLLAPTQDAVRLVIHDDQIVIIRNDATTDRLLINGIRYEPNHLDDIGIPFRDLFPRLPGPVTTATALVSHEDIEGELYFLHFHPRNFMPGPRALALVFPTEEFGIFTYACQTGSFPDSNVITHIVAELQDSE